MKKILPLLLATMAVSAFAEETSASINTLGVLRVDSPLKSTIVAVPWVKLSGTGTDAALSVADYVKTENLTAGDHLYVYNTSTGKYQGWELKTVEGSLVWNPMSTVDDTTFEIVEAPAAAEKGLDLGSALWVERQNPTSGGTPVPFYLVGQVAQAAVTTSITAGTTTAPVWNLVANPNAAPYSLSSITGANTKDVIYLVNDDAAPKKIFQKKKNGAYVWGYTKMVQDGDDYVSTFVTTVSIPQGTGFWYVSAGGTPSFNW